MKSSIEVLHERIAAVCATTKPETRQRMKGLSGIKWRLESIEGLCAGMDNKYGCALVLPGNETVFDGRDNEDLKKKFYEAALGVELAVVLLG